MDDNALAVAAKSGDEQALTTLLERYRSYVYAIAWKIALNEDDALDITQTVCLRLLEKIGDFSGQGAFRSWLGVIASREAINLLRQRGRAEEALAPESLESIPADAQPWTAKSMSLREIIDARMKREAVKKAMKMLSAQQRAIFALRFLEDMRLKEIAEHLGLPAQQVRTQFYRALEKIRTIVGTGR